MESNPLFSESLLRMAENALDQLGEYPHLKKQLQDALDIEPKSMTDRQPNHHDDGLI